jgi:acyl carrier protein
MSEITLEEIKRLVGLQLGARNVSEQDRFLEDLSAESADVANLIASVEEKYKITIKESEIAKIFTPKDLFELVKERTSWRGPSR